MVKAYANGILVDGTYYVAPATVSLANTEDNSTTITGADGYVANVTLAARTLYKDGALPALRRDHRRLAPRRSHRPRPRIGQHQRHHAQPDLRRRRDDA